MDERRIWLLVTSQQLLAHLAEAGPSRPLWQHKIHVGHSGGDSQWQILEAGKVNMQEYLLPIPDGEP